MIDGLEVQYISDPRQLPDLFLLLPDRWEDTLQAMKKSGRLTKLDPGDVFIYERKLGAKTWRIIGVEVRCDPDSNPLRKINEG
jgi:hypothetical protein